MDIYSQLYPHKLDFKNHTGPLIALILNWAQSHFKKASVWEGLKRGALAAGSRRRTHSAIAAVGGRREPSTCSVLVCSITADGQKAGLQPWMPAGTR